MSEAELENARLKQSLETLCYKINQQEQLLQDSELMLKFLRDEETTVSEEMAELNLNDKMYLRKINKLWDRTKSALFVAEEYLLTGKIPK